MAVVKMRLQGKPRCHTGIAKLRADDGSRCSLGWLITDKHYDPFFETRCPNEVMIDILGMPKLDYQFYDDLQDAHDKSALRRGEWWDNFAKEMRKLATKHFLDPSSLTPPPASA